MPPLSLHPDNPHYFLFRGKPTVLITSGEHYGAVLNADFDYRTYLDVLATEGFNLTRLFSGCYCEGPDSIGWIGDQNTLAPRPGRLLSPWARSEVPGAGGGGNKFDLDRWDEAYFARLRDFCAEAGRRGVVVEMVLFCPMYVGLFGEKLWQLSPLHAGNNVNGVGTGPAARFTTLDDPALVARQEAMVRKIAGELAEFDNVYYEICNEPYWSRTKPEETEAWQRRMTEVLAEAEERLGVRHLIAVNIANGSKKVEAAPPSVSVLNFHYCYPPEAVALNYNLNLPIAFDETADGTVAPDRRREAWAFLLAGGAVYSNLDWSFAIDDPTGTGKVEQAGRRYDGREVRRQLRILHDFMRGLDFVRMAPAHELVSGLPEGVTPYCLAEPGRQYAVYLDGAGAKTFALEMPAGVYRLQWWRPEQGPEGAPQRIEHAGGRLTLTPPAYQHDLALVLTSP